MLPIGYSFCPSGTSHRHWSARRGSMLKFMLLNGISLSLHGQRAFIFKALKPANPFWPQGFEGKAAFWGCLMASSTVWACLAEGFHSVLWVIPIRKKGFYRMGERTWNCDVLFKPARNTSYAGCFSHCVFFLSFGTNTVFLYQKEGCSCSQTWGRGRLPLLSLLYSFAGFVACFLKISQACTVMSSACLPTRLFLNLLANFILTW